jgi:hypothetical protein
MDLISTNSFVESPFVIVKMGDYTFGTYTGRKSKSPTGNLLNVDYPNFIRGISVTKINGQVNMYTLNLVYAITQYDDPNMLEKIFSSVRDHREMTLTYGDWNSPSSIYKNETALITSIKSSVSFDSSKIEYTIEGISNSMSLNAATYDFPARDAKPSDIIKELLYNNSYGLLNVFTGMIDKGLVESNNLIASDDKKVKIEAKSATSVIDYLVYLTGYMSSISNNSNDIIKDSMYRLAVIDDNKNKFGGPYFVVRKIVSDANSSSSDGMWSLDVGYPTDNMVTKFDISNDESWAILYDYSSKIPQSKYVYRIDNDGNIEVIESPSISRSKDLGVTTERNKTWWTNMTSYPITVNITIKGLIRPTILMDYIKVNVYFYGKKHISSGLYVITKQVDTINSSGYRTTLTLLRIGGDT